MDTLCLCRVVRDNNGRIHKPPEIVEVKSTVSRADFDPRQMFKVVFADGSPGTVFAEELATT
jgi:hypothetical protein